MTQYHLILLKYLKVIVHLKELLYPGSHQNSDRVIATPAPAVVPICFLVWVVSKEAKRYKAAAFCGIMD